MTTLLYIGIAFIAGLFMGVGAGYRAGWGSAALFNMKVGYRAGYYDAEQQRPYDERYLQPWQKGRLFR